ncbi:hypothetical protein [Caballeronia sp. GACF4]|uniref:endonuclease/exonuclease/phosphatase family protein n=1 Tax=Caballeronia sp. GACF4 TaxID=2921763 RepID=UPI0020282D55|nr:hypothetical protein [Caballeronia sp. GACF4]
MNFGVSVAGLPMSNSDLTGALGHEASFTLIVGRTFICRLYPATSRSIRPRGFEYKHAVSALATMAGATPHAANRQNNLFNGNEMPWSTVGSLVFVWWNTSLSPPIAKPPASKQNVGFVVEQLRDIRQEIGFDILALGEVRSSDLRAIIDGLGDLNLRVHDATDRSGRLIYDTAVIYDSSKLSVESTHSLTDRFGNKALKTGEVVELRVTKTGDQIVVVVSHWPGRRNVWDCAPARPELGSSLRRFVERIHEEAPHAYIILAGDYNDDLFSPSLANHMLATRDRSLVRRNSRFLYNPFWRKLGESHDHDRSNGVEGICGTHFYYGGDHSQWFTFDQNIFSSAFLQDSSLRLNEELCGIVAPSELRTKVMTRREIFDHFPVLGTIELRSES